MGLRDASLGDRVVGGWYVLGFTAYRCVFFGSLCLQADGVGASLRFTFL